MREDEKEKEEKEPAVKQRGESLKKWNASDWSLFVFIITFILWLIAAVIKLLIVMFA